LIFDYRFAQLVAFFWYFGLVVAGKTKKLPDYASF